MNRRGFISAILLAPFAAAIARIRGLSAPAPEAGLSIRLIRSYDFRMNTRDMRLDVIGGWGDLDAAAINIANQIDAAAMDENYFGPAADYDDDELDDELAA